MRTTGTDPLKTEVNDDRSLCYGLVTSAMEVISKQVNIINHHQCCLSPDACKYGGEGGDLRPKYAQIYRILALGKHILEIPSITPGHQVYKTPHMV